LLAGVRAANKPYLHLSSSLAFALRWFKLADNIKRAENHEPLANLDLPALKDSDNPAVCFKSSSQMPGEVIPAVTGILPCRSIRGERPTATKRLNVPPDLHSRRIAGILVRRRPSHWRTSRQWHPAPAK
jgi:hypothetical protein